MDEIDTQIIIHLAWVCTEVALQGIFQRLRLQCRSQNRLATELPPARLCSRDSLSALLLRKAAPA